MIEKMHFVNIAGPIKNFENFIIQNIAPYEIQLVNALGIYETVKGIRRFEDINPYQGLIGKVRKLGEVAGVAFEYDESAPITLTPTYTIEPEIDGYERQLETIQHISHSLKEDLAEKKQLRKQIIPIQNLEVQVEKFFDFDYMKFRFGVIPAESFEKVMDYVREMEVIVYEISREEDQVYMMYFMPRSMRASIDSFFASLYFKRIRLSDDIHGMPHEALRQLNEEIEELTERIDELDKQARDYVNRHIKRLDELYTYVVQLDAIFDVRYSAVRTEETFYLTGWIPETKLKDFVTAVDTWPTVTCVIEKDEDIKNSVPPTKLHNHKLLQPFESLVRMYGTPSYNEVDPTLYVAITYLLLFGGMFGDVGQGLVIALLGYGLYEKTNNSFGILLTYLGGVSIIFGFIYGSVFGNEEILTEIFGYTPINPMEIKMEILMVTIAFGVVLILIAMIINIRNCYKQHNIGKLLFDRNGVAGMIFYLAVLGIALATVQNITINPAMIVILVVGPMIVIFLAHPLTNLLEGREHILPKDKSGFFIEAIFELIETLLAFLSNTISFMRIGAFALNHVGFFLAFHMLSDIVGQSTGTVGSVIVMIIGNILIIALEGLIVGIQGMRLEYYELFSRFFDGNGYDFKPFKIKNMKDGSL